MPQSSKYLLYAFLAVQLLLNVTLLNAAVIRRDKREIVTNVTGITSSNNEVDSATTTTEEDVGTSLLGTQSSGSGGTTTGNPFTDATNTNLSEDKKKDTMLTGFGVDENTVGFGSNGLESPSYNGGRDKVDPAKSVDEKTTVVSLTEGDKNDFHGESTTADETTSSQSTMNIPTDIGKGLTLKEETTQAADTRPSTLTTVVIEDTTASITHPSIKIDEAVTEHQVTVAKPSVKIEEKAIAEEIVTVTHSPVKIGEAVAEELVTDDKSIYPVTVTNPSVKITEKQVTVSNVSFKIEEEEEAVALKQVTNDASLYPVTVANPFVKIDEVVVHEQFTNNASMSQVTVPSTTASADAPQITTTDAITTIEGISWSGLKLNVGESLSAAQMQADTEESNGDAFSTVSSHGLTDETTMKVSTALFIENLNLTDGTTPLTSTVKSDETTLILTSTEAAEENPNLHQDPLQSQEIKNSTPSSAEKRGKFIDDNYSSLNDLRLPNTSDVWALAGLKSAGRIKSSELPNSLETSDEKAVNTSMVTKSLFDWSRVMSSEGMESETTIKIITTDVPTTTTTKEVKTIHENEVEMLTTKPQPDVTTEVLNLTDRDENQETTSLGENEVDTKASLSMETTTIIEDESTPVRFDDTSPPHADDDIATTTKATLILLKGRDDAYIQDNQVDPDSVEQKPHSPTTTTTTITTPIPDLVVTMKRETTNSPVNGETTEVENSSTFATSTLSAIDFTTSMPFLTSTSITTTTSTSTPSIAFNMDDRTNEPPNMASTPTPPTQSATTVEPSTTTTETPAVTVMAATTESETQTTEAHTPTAIISSNDAMTQNANNYNNYEVVNKTTTQFADSSSIEASEASTRVAPNWSLSTAETTTTATEVDRVDVDFDVTTASILDYSNAFEIATPQPSTTTTTVASAFTFAATSTTIPIITASFSNSPSTTENLDHIDSIQKISDTAETSIESNVIDPLHAGVASTKTATTTTTATTQTTTTTTENNQENMRMQSTGSGEMDSTSTTTAVYDDSTTTLQSISTKKEDVYSIVPTIDSGFHVPKLVVDDTTVASVLAAGTGGVGEAMDPPDGQETDVNVIIAISVSTVGIVALILLVAFLYVMRKRQKQMSYGQRCRPVSLDAYSLDNVSVYNSVRRKGATLRASKRSYGNVAFDDPSLRHNVMGTHELAKYVEKKSSIWEEYRDVPQIIARADEVPAGCEDKNRYANVIPLPETRVILQQQNNDEKSEYINANYVRGPKDTTNYYIACQAPLDTTVTDFWRMIWEQNSRVIIMATDLIENGIDKCAEYLPPSVTLDNHTVFGDFQVTLKNREVKEKYAISTLMLRNNVTEESREITHYWYQWPESGVPTDEAAVIAMLLEARSSLKAYTIEQGDNKADTIITDETKSEINGNVTSEKPKQSPKDQGPLTIHCSPGTGRTGTILACDIAMRCLEEPKRCVDIPQIVYSVRRGRASAVQTKEQYEFIYKVTHMYATKISNINNDN